MPHERGATVAAANLKMASDRRGPRHGGREALWIAQTICAQMIDDGRSGKSLVAYRNNSFRFTVEQDLADSDFSALTSLNANQPE